MMKTTFYSTALFLLVLFKSQAGVIVLNGLTHTFSGNSGEYIQGELVLMNTTDQEQQIVFKLNDAIYSCGNDRIFSDSITHEQSSKSWFEGNLMDKFIGPKEKFVYKYQIKIPEDKSINGTFWSVLMIEIAKPVKKEHLTRQIDLSTKIRYAVGLITHVNQASNVELDFTDVHINKNELNENSLKINLLNKSKYVEGVQLNLEVYDEEGENILKSKTKRLMVFPGMCIDYNLDISTLKKGTYQCILTADSRKEYIGTNISLNIN
ncbi:WxL protein host-binding domain-containing protein [Leeuwenhoekiella sp. W20_SRS_FM14]|uniref:WxL protein host-binding domain-containing protein n=1 Tax=Leeuwenhoekiella sp. W20_SRS_FM14 TaxID=3240270 RepID=UPI003F9EA35B